MAVSGQGFSFTFQSLVGIILKQNLQTRSCPLCYVCVCVRPWAVHIWDEIKGLLSAHVSDFWLASSPLNVLGLIQEKRVFKNHTSEGKKKKNQLKFYVLGWHFSLNINDLIIISLSERWVMKVQKSSDRKDFEPALLMFLVCVLCSWEGKGK